MKVKVIWCVFFIALFLLLIFQFAFLYKIFILEREAVREDLNILFKAALEKEVGDRFINSGPLMEANPEKYNRRSFTIEYDDTDNIAEQGLMSVKFQDQQKLMDYIGFPLDLVVLDSIYHSLLSEKSVFWDYSLVYRDSTNVINSIRNIPKFNYVTNPVFIVQDRTVQANFYIPIPFFIKDMLSILVTSMLILFLIVGCLVYEMRVIFTQRRLSQLRDDFSHALIHDMKTPLSTIYMAVDQWRKGNLDKNAELRAKFCATSMSQVLNLQALVDKILTIARLEEGKITLEKRIIDVPEMIRGLENKFTLQSKKKVRFEVDFRMEDAQVMADPIYLSNAVSNLIDNAIKYSGDPVSIHINCHSINDKLIIEVSDNGFGISLKDQRKIFEKFERGAAVGRKGAKGFGLGLNYVKRVMEAHGGTVTLSSLEGEGSTFVLYMPLIVTPI